MLIVFLHFPCSFDGKLEKEMRPPVLYLIYIVHVLKIVLAYFQESCFFWGGGVVLCGLMERVAMCSPHQVPDTSSSHTSPFRLMMMRKKKKGKVLVKRTREEAPVS